MFTIELFWTFNVPPTCIPLAPLLLALTVELSIVNKPADKPWPPLLLKFTFESWNSKCDPLDPLPVLLTTSILLLFIVFTVNVPVNPERLLSLKYDELSSRIL